MTAVRERELRKRGYAEASSTLTRVACTEYANFYHPRRAKANFSQPQKYLLEADLNISQLQLPSPVTLHRQRTTLDAGDRPFKTTTAQLDAKLALEAISRTLPLCAETS